jgi:hypothetical protein
MGEEDAPALDREHARPFRFVERILRQRGRRDVRRGRDAERHVPGLRRQVGDPACGELDEAPGQGQRRVRVAVGGQGPRDLEHVERIAAGGRCDPNEQGPGRRVAQFRAEQVMERGERERAQLESLVLVTLEPERGLVLEPPSENEPRSRGKPACGERQHRRRGGVDPLQVVHGEDERLLRSQLSRESHDRRAEHAGIRPTLPAQQPCLECAQLWRRKRVARLVVDGADQVGEGGVRESLLPLRRARVEHPVTGAGGRVDRGPPQRRLADPGLSLEQKRAAGSPRREELLDSLQLVLTAEDRSDHGAIVAYDTAAA